MKKIILIVAVVFAANGLYAQSITPQVIASTGNFFSGSSGSISFTMGELAITTITANSNTITQGFQQPDNQFPSRVLKPEEGVVFQVYPNPAHQVVNIDYDLGSASATLIVTDAQGKVWRAAEQITGKGSVNTQSWNFAAGIYFINLRNDDFSISEKLVMY